MCSKLYVGASGRQFQLWDMKQLSVRLFRQGMVEQKFICIYNSPGYLFEGARPVITSAPLVINYDEEFEVSYDVTSDPAPEIDSIVLISLPSVTHCYDSNQRYIEMDFELSVNFGALNVTAPLDEYIAPPGYYMLFLLQKKHQSVSGEVRIPSVARIVKLVPVI